MKKYTIIAVLLSFTIGLAGQKTELKTTIDSVSYSIGMSMYKASTNYNLEIDYEMLTRGILAGAAHDTAWNADSANNYLNHYRLRQRQIEINRQKIGITNQFFFIHIIFFVWCL